MLTGILLTQLGTPKDASKTEVKNFLKEFLSDPHVIHVNRLLWWPLLHGIVLNTRPKRSAMVYARFFALYGRTLITYVQSLTKKLQAHFDPQNTVIADAMRYGEPSLQQGLNKLKSCDRILVVPLFPQFSHTTTGSIQDEIKKSCAARTATVQFLPPFFAHPLYIDSLFFTIEQALKERSQPPQLLLLSYHGIPQSYIREGDPYLDHCTKTTELVKQRIKDIPISQCFQSRFGKAKWLEPSTDETLQKLAHRGIRDVMVLCPSFTMDCLETLDEIGIEGVKLFKIWGGKYLQVLSCLNDNDNWARNLAHIIQEQL